MTCHHIKLNPLGYNSLMYYDSKAPQRAASKVTIQLYGARRMLGILDFNNILLH